MKKIFLLLFLPFYLFCQDSSSPYGINAHLPSSSVVFDKIKDAGIKWVRLDFNWDEIEPFQGYFDWSHCDRVVNQALERGLSIFASLAYTPPWAGDGSKNSVPRDSNLWRNFVRRAVERYRGRILYWGMWNEPNLKEFWKGSVDDYINIILIPGSQTLKSVDSNSKVVAPDLSHLFGAFESRWDNWLNKILSSANQYMDVISHHIYDTPDNCFLKMESYDPKNPLAPSLLKVIRDSGAGNKPLWITETGWNTWEVTEDTQANYYKRFLQLMKSKGYVNKVFFYEIMDDPRENIPPFGILRADLSEKKAYFAYKEFIANEETQKEPKEGKRCPVEWIYRDEEKIEILGELKQLKEEKLSSSFQGMRNVELYYRFAPEIIMILSKDIEGKEFIKRWTEKLVFALRMGEDFVIEKDELKEMRKVTERIKLNSTPELKVIINEIESSFFSKDRVFFSEILNFAVNEDLTGILQREKK